MKTTYKITNQVLFDKKIVDVDTTGLIGFHGTLTLEIEGKGKKEFWGEHGANDYQDEFGFILI